VKYVTDDGKFDVDLFMSHIPPIVRMMDNVIDTTIYPLKAQEIEARNKRRMGLGVTGVANAAEALGLPYGSPEMIEFMEDVMIVLRDTAYRASIGLAVEKGPFPFFNEKYLDSEFIQTLPKDIIEDIGKYGIRNSHLLSIAPTGTISLFAGNVSSGIEPPFSLEYERRTIMPDGSIKWWNVMDYAYDRWGIKGRTSDQLTAQEHIDVLCAASALVDSACSKTCNVGDDVSFEEFKKLYISAYEGGASGCTTFRPASIETRGEVLRNKAPSNEGEQCVIDPITGERSCAD
jgi:ribonucleoside-diphosphate reductase alpha chain